MQPLYTLEQLAGFTGLSVKTWRRVVDSYPGYFFKLAGTVCIRSASLDELLQLHEGDELKTREMDQATKDALALRRKQLASTGPRP